MCFVVAVDSVVPVFDFAGEDLIQNEGRYLHFMIKLDKALVLQLARLRIPLDGRNIVYGCTSDCVTRLLFDGVAHAVWDRA